MESRLRKLLSPRRLKAQRSSAPVIEPDLPAIPSNAAPPPPQGRRPILFSQVLGKAASVKRKPDLDLDLRSFSYESTAPGRPPRRGDRPQHGNGPVKLQTSRRLSSGELLVTEQDYDRTLEDLREGEYIVGGKENRTSRTSSQPKSPTNPPDLKFISSAPVSPREQFTFANPPWPPSSVTTDVASPVPSAASRSTFPLRASSAHGHVHPYPQSHLTGHGLGISSTPSPQFYPRHMASTTSLLEPHEEQNPTIQALWKAEYTRLVSIYGQDGVDRNIVELNQDRIDTSSSFVDRRPSARQTTPYNASSTFSLSQTLYPPPDLLGRGLSLRGNASTPNLDLRYRDEHSDWSSQQRHSLLSSSGASSSFTTRTSVAEDSVTSREDLRKIVDDMRMTYLQAIEAQTPPLHSTTSDAPARRPQSKKQTPSYASSASVASSFRSASRQSSSGTRTKSWQSSTTHATTPRTSMSSPNIKSSLSKHASSGGASRRVSGQPVAGIATLPAIKASPARSNRAESAKRGDNIGLKRADSTTLGSMARQLKILDERNSGASSLPTLASSSPVLEPSSSSESDSGPETTTSGPLSSTNSSPAKASSVQNTPQKVRRKSHKEAAPANHSWQLDVDRLFNDAELDLALDIDDFETLCDGLFSSPALGNDQLGAFQTWAEDEPSDSDALGRHHHMAAARSGSPSPKPKVKVTPAPPTGLGLTGISTMA